jgi:hypothetical protein
MSKFVDKLQRLSKSSAPSIGFHPAASEPEKSSMLLVAELSGVDIKEVKVIADGNVDAGLIFNQHFNTKIIKQMVEVMADVPLGVFVKDMSEEKMNELTGWDCDFIVFSTKIPAVVLQDEKIGKFLMIEPSLEQGLVRAINGIEVDGVFINRGEESFITIEHLLICQRFSELLSKPLVVTLPSLATSAELSNLWQIGIDGIVIPSAQPKETFTELRKVIDNLPRRTKRWRGKIDVVLPRYAGDVAVEEEEEEEL